MFFQEGNQTEIGVYHQQCKIIFSLLIKRKGKRDENTTIIPFYILYGIKKFLTSVSKNGNTMKSLISVYHRCMANVSANWKYPPCGKFYILSLI